MLSLAQFLPSMPALSEPVAVVPALSRFTLDGDDALEAQLALICRCVRAGLRRILPGRQLEAVLLGGGYGRGEGGVLRTPEGDRPYNDMEFYVLVRGSCVVNEWRHGAALHRLAHELSLAAGIEVEFKLLSLARLRSERVSMFSYDLVRGHQWVHGGEHLLEGCAHHREAADIPLSEATRLLMNRSSGLLFARERLVRGGFTAEDADFVGRNLAKVRLALGDAVLTTLSRYHWSCRTRQNRLATMTAPAEWPWMAQVRQEHERGVRFKLHPHVTTDSQNDLRTQWDEVADLARRVWLWLESRRLGDSFESVRAYAEHPADKCPGTPRWRNWLVNVRHREPGAWTGGREALRYPRERLLRALPLLLWEAEVVSKESALVKQLQRELATSATEWVDLVHAYTRVWERYR